MLVVNHLGVSQSDRIVWLCEELGIPYDLVKFDRDPTTGGGPADYKALHPYGTAPVIKDGDLLLGESGAIVEYLIAKYAPGRLIVAPDQANFADYLYWFHFANGTFMASGMVAMVLARLGDTSELARQMSNRWLRAFSHVERRLGEAPYFAGPEFTAADIMMHFPLTTMRLFAPYDISGLPNLLAYLQRIAERPAFKQTRLKGDPDMPLNLT